LLIAAKNRARKTQGEARSVFRGSAYVSFFAQGAKNASRPYNRPVTVFFTMPFYGFFAMLLVRSTRFRVPHSGVVRFFLKKPTVLIVSGHYSVPLSSLRGMWRYAGLPIFITA
jgi:hypothetical protein